MTAPERATDLDIDSADDLDGAEAASPSAATEAVSHVVEEDVPPAVRIPVSRSRKGNSSQSLRKTDLEVRSESRADWARGSDTPPVVGDTVLCTAGEGTVTALHGKTGDGSRLVQVRLADGKSPPFFAAASNLLVMPH